jgi:hypothetical protein
MIGGPESFGAGGWIGSPVEDALPVRLDPPQKRQMPRGALALVVHSVEIPQGVYYGKQVCNAAVDALSRLDLIGIVEYQGMGGTDWVAPHRHRRRPHRRQACDPEPAVFGDMPDFDPSLQLALAGLQAVEAGQKHCIIISDGDPMPPRSTSPKFRDAGITISAVGVPALTRRPQHPPRPSPGRPAAQYYSVGNSAPRHPPADLHQGGPDRPPSADLGG